MLKKLMLLLQTRLRLLPLVSFLPFVFVSFQARSRFTFVFFISASSPYRSCRYHLCFTLAWHLVSVFFFFVPCVRTLICSTDVVRLCAEFVQLSLCDQFTFCSCVFMTCISLGTLREDLICVYVTSFGTLCGDLICVCVFANYS